MLVKKEDELDKTKVMNSNFILIFLAFVFSCNVERETSHQNEYLRWVGDIEYDPLIDSDEFTICHGDSNVLQYFNVSDEPTYLGGKPVLVSVFKNEYQPVVGHNQDGYIRIRFIVNCSGQAGRFRMIQSDLNFNRIEFDKRIVSQLFEITGKVGEWVILNREGKPVDYYFYLIFKIIDGQITEILP